MESEPHAGVRARAPRVRALVGAVAVLATVAVVGWLVRVDGAGRAPDESGPPEGEPESPAADKPPPEAAPTPRSTAAALPERTGVLLVLSDGHAVTTVDVDAGRVQRVGVDALTGGDPSFVLAGRGEAVAFFGTDGDTYAAYGAALEAPWLLGASMSFVPSSEPDRVWLVTAAPGQAGQRLVREVAVDGRTTVPERPAPTGLVEAAAGGGLVLADQATQTLRVWDPRTDEITAELDGRHVAAGGQHLAACVVRCTELVIADLDANAQVTVDAPEGAVWRPAGAFSAGGQLLATSVETHAGEARLAVVEVEDGKIRLLEHPELATPPVWGSHGRWLLAVTGEGEILVYDAEVDRSHLLAVDLPTRTFHGIAAVPADPQALGSFGGAHAPHGPRLEDGLVLSADPAEGLVRAVIEGTGETAWTRALGVGAALGPRIGDLVLAAPHAGAVVALEIASGIQRWRLDLDEAAAPGAPAVADGTAYLPVSFLGEGDVTAPQVHAVDVTTGEPLWRRDLEPGTDLQWHPPVVTDELVLVTDTPAHPDAAPTSWLHALDRDSGEVVWRFDLDDDRQGFHYQPPLIAGDIVVVASPSGNLFALDLTTSQEHWRRTAATRPELIDLDRERLIVVLDGDEQHLDPTTGRQLPNDS